MIKLRTAVAVLLLTVIPTGQVFAQAAGKMLDYPPKAEDIPGLMVLKKQLDVKLDYIGRKYSVDMWVASKDDVAQIIYTTLDGRGLLTNGFLFDENGDIVTDKHMADVQTDEPSIVQTKADKIIDNMPKLSPGDKFWAGIEKKHYISFGSEKAPVMYVFMDTNCPFCKKYWKVLEPFVDKGDVQVRIVPVGILGVDSAESAANLLGETEKQGAWLKIVKGTYLTKGKPSSENMAKVGENSIFMKEWEIESTPFSAYRDKFGKVKLMRGFSEDVTAIIDEMRR